LVDSFESMLTLQRPSFGFRALDLFKI